MANQIEENTELVPSPLSRALSFEDFINYINETKYIDGATCLIHCPTFAIETFSAEVALKKGYYAYPPTGLQCLQVSLSKEGLEAEILDLNFEILKKVNENPSNSSDVSKLLINILDEYFNTHDISIVGVSAGVIVSNIFGIPNHPFVQTLEYLRVRNQHVVFCGGVIATNESGNILKKGLAHAVISGEAENRLPYAIKSLKRIKTSKSFEGIFFSDGKRIGQTRGEHDVVNFTDSLIESYKNIHIEQYNEVGSLSPFSRMIGAGKKYATVQLNRGCRGRCTFCGVIPFMGKGVRQYPIENVISEIEFLVKERGIEHIEWLDDDLLKYPDAISEVMKYIRDQKLPITWAANNGLIAAAITEENISLMEQSGCIGFRIGIESGNEEMLKKIRKPATRQNLLEASKLFQKHPSLFVVGCYIIGFENETYKQLLDTFQLSILMDLGWNGFSVFQIIRDSANALEEFGNESEKDTGSDTNYEKISNFVPSKEKPKGEIGAVERFDIRRIFSGDLTKVHNPENLNEIWFAFNLISNYICNRHLRAGGSPEIFIQWIKSLQMTHPDNPCMSLFLSLAYQLSGQTNLAKQEHEFTKRIIVNSKYWHERFLQYYLMDLQEELPLSTDEIYSALNEIREKFCSILP